MDPDVPFHADVRVEQEASQTGRLVIPEELEDTKHEPPAALVERLNELAEKDVVSTNQHNWEQVVQSHADGNGYPINEYELQELLNMEHITPTFTLRSLPGEMTKHQAQCIIWSELTTNFRNSIAHLREAREIYPDDEFFSQTDLQVLMHMKNNDPPRAGGKEETKKRGKLGSLFKKKKDKDGKTVANPEEPTFTVPDGMVEGTEEATTKKGKKEKKDKEKKEKKEKKKKKDTHSDGEAPEKEKKRFGLFKKKKKGSEAGSEEEEGETHPHIAADGGPAGTWEAGTMEDPSVATVVA